MATRESPILKVLKEIRDELRGTNQRLDRVEDRVEDLSKRQTQTEVRLATELVSVTSAIGQVRDLLREHLDGRRILDDHENRIRLLERKSA